MTKPRPKLLVSRCLLGQPCRYDGTRRRDLTATLLALGICADDIIAVCPEMDGGLPVPRLPCEIEPGADGRDVTAHCAKVLTRCGKDCTAEYLRGAIIALAQARTNGVRTALLKAKSPSCGNTEIYDGTHSGVLKSGQGVTAALLTEAGITCLNETELSKLAALY